MSYLDDLISGFGDILPSKGMPTLSDRLKRLLNLNSQKTQESAPAPQVEQPKIEIPELTAEPNKEEFRAGTTRLSAVLKGIAMILQNRNNIKAKNEEMKIHQAERAEDRRTAREDLAYKLEQTGKYDAAADQRRASREEDLLKLKQQYEQDDPMYKAKLQYLNKQIDHYGKGGSGGGGGSLGGRVIQTKDGVFQLTKDANGMPVMKRVEEQKGPLQTLMDFFTGGRKPNKNYKPFQDKLNRYTDEEGKDHTDVIRYDSGTGEIMDIMDYNDYRQGLKVDAQPVVSAEGNSFDAQMDKFMNKKSDPSQKPATPVVNQNQPSPQEINGLTDFVGEDGRTYKIDPKTKRIYVPKN